MYAPWRSSIVLSVLTLTLITLTSCVGIYDNTKRFMNLPAEGTDELQMIREYGSPDFTTTVEDQKVYTYKVRKVGYYVVVGIYEGYDLMVVCRDGRIVESKKIPHHNSFTIFQPVPWSVAD